jgi:hypothetical protein
LVRTLLLDELLDYSVWISLVLASLSDLLAIAWQVIVLPFNISEATATLTSLLIGTGVKCLALVRTCLLDDELGCRTATAMTVTRNNYCWRKVLRLHSVQRRDDADVKLFSL